MSRPLLLAVEDDAQRFPLLQQELRNRYSVDYEVICLPTSEEALRTLDEARTAGREVALVLADVWLDSPGDGRLLHEVKARHPSAMSVALVRWNDPGSAGPELFRQHTQGNVDDWISDPWAPGDEHFHQGISAFLYQWARRHRPGPESTRVIGRQWAARSHQIRDILSRNSVAFAFIDVDGPQGAALVRGLGLQGSPLPIVVTPSGQVLVDPPNGELAAALGVLTAPPADRYDVVVVGAGPAGLAAAVYGASEGLHTLVVEREAIGGQAGSSSAIRNYLGFPRGVTGTELAIRAIQQARLFGADIIYGEAIGIDDLGADRAVLLHGGGSCLARAVVLATGVSYRRLGIADLERFTGAGVFYGGATSEAQAMAGLPVHVLGGANSAGQAALHLAAHASDVTLVVRAANLADSMSQYLIRQIEATPVIRVRCGTEVVGGGGDGRLSSVTLRDRATGATYVEDSAGLFVLIGAEPHTSWLPPSIRRDRRGYVLTGTEVLGDAQPRWPLERPPLPFETSLPGVFAVGDVRRSDVKRVAASVGDGSVAVRLLHEYLSHETIGIS